MHYLITLNYEPGTGVQEGTPEFDAEMDAWGELKAAMRDAGVYVAASGVDPDATTTVRPGGVVTDGPHAETKEVMFSFFILDVADLDAALAWANRMPSGIYGSAGVHPMVGYEE